MYFNSKKLIDTWHEWVYKIVELNKDHLNFPLHKDTIFIEQRLLPAILPAYNFKWRNLSPHTYLHIKVITGWIRMGTFFWV
jgi:hypothetical protein